MKLMLSAAMLLLTACTASTSPEPTGSETAADSPGCVVDAIGCASPGWVSYTCDATSEPPATTLTSDAGVTYTCLGGGWEGTDTNRWHFCCPGPSACVPGTPGCPGLNL